MRFIHLGDLHIGKTVNDFNMIEDQVYILDQIVDLVLVNKVQGVLIAGDVYDKTIPSEEAVRTFDSFLYKLSQAGIKTYLISGNHDSEERLNFGSKMFERSNIFIASRFEGKLAKQVVEDEYGKLNIYMLPFVKASQVRRHYPEAKIENYEDAVRTVIEQEELNLSERNLMIAHQFVAGGGGQVVYGGSENLAVQNVGTVEKVGYHVFDAFDYVALGHIHAPQRVGRDTVRYSGSILTYSLSEIGKQKSVPIVSFGEKGEVEIELLALKPKYNMRALKGKLQDLLAPENVTDVEDYIYVKLLDEDPIPNVVNIIREHYKKLMKVEYENSHSREMGQVDIKELTRGKSFEELISEFYGKMYGCEISEEELKIMKQVAREAGVEYEAD